MRASAIRLAIVSMKKKKKGKCRVDMMLDRVTQNEICIIKEDNNIVINVTQADTKEVS